MCNIALFDAQGIDNLNMLVLLIGKIALFSTQGRDRLFLSNGDGTLHAIAKEAIEALMSMRLEISSTHALIPAPVHKEIHGNPHTNHNAVLEALKANIVGAVTQVEKVFSIEKLPIEWREKLEIMLKKSERGHA